MHKPNGDEERETDEEENHTMSHWHYQGVGVLQYMYLRLFLCVQTPYGVGYDRSYLAPDLHRYTAKVHRSLILSDFEEKSAQARCQLAFSHLK